MAFDVAVLKYFETQNLVCCFEQLGQGLLYFYDLFCLPVRSLTFYTIFAKSFEGRVGPLYTQLYCNKAPSSLLSEPVGRNF